MQKYQIRVLIVDSHPIVREGLRQFLEAEGECKVVAEAADFAENSPEPDPSELYTDVLVESY